MGGSLFSLSLIVKHFVLHFLLYEKCYTNKVIIIIIIIIVIIIIITQCVAAFLMFIPSNG